MAHHFMRAPDASTVSQALRWGQIIAMGGDARLARALVGTRLGESFAQEAFWVTVVRWFIAHPMLDVVHVGPIIDYLHNQKFVSEEVVVAARGDEPAAPPQPNLSMRGRTPDSLLRQVRLWHDDLAHDNRQQLRQWSPSGLPGFEFEEGSSQNQNLKHWTIRELVSSRALIAEGRRLKHCVASYAGSCARGHSSIWTMEVESADGVAKALTIEVRTSTRTICQARGRLNRLPTDKQRAVMRRWAARVGLKIADDV